MKHANPEAERIVLGALLDCEGPLLRSTAETLIAAIGLSGDDFTVPMLRAWFNTVRALATRQRRIDASTVWSLSRGLGDIPTDGHITLGELQGANG